MTTKNIAVRKLSHAEIAALPTFVGFYAIEQIFTPEEAAERERERQRRRRLRGE